MNTLEIYILILQFVVHLKMAIQILSSCALIVLSIVMIMMSPDKSLDYIFIGTTIAGTISIMYAFQKSVIKKIYQLPRLIPLCWSIFITVKLQEEDIIDDMEKWIIGISYVSSIMNIVILRFP